MHTSCKQCRWVTKKRITATLSRVECECVHISIAKWRRRRRRIVCKTLHMRMRSCVCVAIVEGYGTAKFSMRTKAKNAYTWRPAALLSPTEGSPRYVRHRIISSSIWVCVCVCFRVCVGVAELLPHTRMMSVVRLTSQTIVQHITQDHRRAIIQLSMPIRPADGVVVVQLPCG